MESNRGSKLSFTSPVRHSHDVENLVSDSLLLMPVPQASSTLGQNNPSLTSHSREQPFECTACRTRFTKSYNLKRHERHHCKPHECPSCGMRFKIHSELKQHVRIHTDAKPYSCRHCSDCFTLHRQLKTHLLKSHNEGTWFTCDICQKKFSSKQACVLCIAVICRCSTQYSFQLRALWCILIKNHSI